MQFILFITLILVKIRSGPSSAFICVTSSNLQQKFWCLSLERPTDLAYHLKWIVGAFFRYTQYRGSKWRCFSAVSAVDCDQIKTACHGYTSRNDYLAMNSKLPDCIGKDAILSLKINTGTWELILGVNKEEAYIHWLDRRSEVFGLGVDNTRQRLIMICISCIKLVSNNSTQ